jgi:hypothetical protein
MDQTRTHPAARTRHTTLVAAAAAGVVLAAGAGIALAAGAAAHDASTTATAAASTAASPQTMAGIWAQSEQSTRAHLCTAFQANPDGTWQSVAPVLVPSGITRAEVEAHLAGACSASAGVAGLR